MVVFSSEFQSTSLALRTPAIKTGNPPLKHADRSYPAESNDRPAFIVVLPHSGNNVLPASQWHRDSPTQEIRPLSCAGG
jgi:hypothetical protein